MFKLPNEVVTKLNNAKNDKNILFFLPGVEGNCAVFNDTAELLEKQNIQVYALQFTANIPNESVQEISSFYLNVIENEMQKLNANKFYLAGYSFGGVVAIELCKQMSTAPTQLKVLSLFLFESSHKIFNAGAHVNAIQFNFHITNNSIFEDPLVYNGTLAIFLCFMINNPRSKNDMYNYLKTRCRTLDESIEKAFGFIKDKSLYQFENEQEIEDMRIYLKILMLKSNAAFVYGYGNEARLNMPVYMFKSKNFIYKSQINNLYYKESRDLNKLHKLEIDSHDFSLKEIVQHKDLLKIVDCDNGNHWSFLYENSNFIYEHMAKAIGSSKSKL
jgi:surfactin synthase thioesterase subunit